MRNNRGNTERSDNHEAVLGWLTAAVLLLGILLRLVRFGSVPAGFHVDELGSAYDSWCLAHYGTDRYGISYPVYFINFGGGQNALYDYLCMLCIRILGYHAVSIRLPALFASALLGIFGTLSARLMWPKKAAAAGILFAALYAFSPYCFMVSRFGLESHQMAGWSALFLYCLLRAAGKGSIRSYVLAGVTAGLVLYTYAISYLVLPVFLIAALVVLRRNCQISFRHVCGLAVPLALLAFPLILEQYVNYRGLGDIRLGIFTVTQLQSYRAGEFTLTNIPENLFLTLKSSLAYDWLDYNTSSRFWTFYPISLPFALVGFACVCAQLRRSPGRGRTACALILCWFASMLLVGSLLGGHGETGSNPNANKINGIFPAQMLFIVSGWICCAQMLGTARRRRLYAGAMAAVYLCFACSFFCYYMGEYRPASSFFREAFEPASLEEAMDYADREDSLQGKLRVIPGNYIYYLAAALPAPSENGLDRGGNHGGESRYGNIVSDIDLEEGIERYGASAVYLLPAGELTPEQEAFFEAEGYSRKNFGRLVMYWWRQ